MDTMDTMVIYHVTMCQEMDVELGKEVGQELPGTPSADLFVAPDHRGHLGP